MVKGLQISGFKKLEVVMAKLTSHLKALQRAELGLRTYLERTNQRGRKTTASHTESANAMLRVTGEKLAATKQEMALAVTDVGRLSSTSDLVASNPDKRAWDLANNNIENAFKNVRTESPINEFLKADNLKLSSDSQEFKDLVEQQNDLINQAKAEIDIYIGLIDAQINDQKVTKTGTFGRESEAYEVLMNIRQEMKEVRKEYDNQKQQIEQLVNVKKATEQTSNQKVQSLENKVQTLETQLTLSQQQATNSAEELLKAKQEAETNKDKVAKAEQTIKERDAMQVQRDMAMQQNQKLTVDLAEKDQKLKQLENVAEDYKALKDATESSRSVGSLVQKELNKAQSELKVAKEDIEHYKQKIERLEKSDSQQLTSENEALKTENAQLKEELKSEKNQHQALKEEHAELQSKYKAVVRELATAFKTFMTAVKSALGNAHPDMAKITTAVNKENNNIQGYKEKIETLEVQNKALEAGLQKALSHSPSSSPKMEPKKAHQEDSEKESLIGKEDNSALSKIRNILGK